MSNSMIERVAEAIFLKEGRAKDVAWKDADKVLAIMLFEPGSFVPRVSDYYRDIARAAISAMREPTEKMRIASGDALYLPLERARELAEEEKFNEFANDGVKAYTAMIDAALK